MDDDGSRRRHDDLNDGSLERREGGQSRGCDNHVKSFDDLITAAYINGSMSSGPSLSVLLSCACLRYGSPQLIVSISACFHFGGNLISKRLDPLKRGASASPSIYNGESIRGSI